MTKKKLEEEVGLLQHDMETWIGFSDTPESTKSREAILEEIGNYIDMTERFLYNNRDDGGGVPQPPPSQ